MSARPWAGTSTISSIIAITGSVAPGMPAVPMPPRMQMSMMTSCCPRLRSTPKTWARNSTVTPSNSAEPFWFIDAPAVSTNRAIARGSPSSVSATRSVVGKVAALDAVANAVVSASREPRKNVAGPMPPSTRTKIG